VVEELSECCGRRQKCCRAPPEKESEPETVELLLKTCLKPKELSATQASASPKDIYEDMNTVQVAVFDYTLCFFTVG